MVSQNSGHAVKGKRREEEVGDTTGYVFPRERAKARQQTCQFWSIAMCPLLFFVLRDREVHILGVPDQGEAGRCRCREIL